MHSIIGMTRFIPYVRLVNPPDPYLLGRVLVASLYPRKACASPRCYREIGGSSPCLR